MDSLSHIFNSRSPEWDWSWRSISCTRSTTYVIFFNRPVSLYKETIFYFSWDWVGTIMAVYYFSMWNQMMAWHLTRYWSTNAWCRSCECWHPMQELPVYVNWLSKFTEQVATLKMSISRSTMLDLDGYKCKNRSK